MKEKDNKGFWNRWAKRYDFAMSGDGRTYAQIVSRMKKVLSKDMAVLELACGTGLLSVRIAGSVKLLEATDFSEEMIRQAKAKAHSSRLHFSVQDATNLPYTPGTFDAVVISNALHIMPEPEKALAERFPGSMVTFDAVNTAGLKGVNAEVKMAGNKTKSFFSLERPKEELEGWSEHIMNVMERDYIDGYLKGGWRKSIVTRIFAWVMRTFHMGFMIHAEFRERQQ